MIQTRDRHPVDGLVQNTMLLSFVIAMGVREGTKDGEEFVPIHTAIHELLNSQSPTSWISVGGVRDWLTRELGVNLDPSAGDTMRLHDDFYRMLGDTPKLAVLLQHLFSSNAGQHPVGCSADPVLWECVLEECGVVPVRAPTPWPYGEAGILGSKPRPYQQMVHAVYVLFPILLYWKLSAQNPLRMTYGALLANMSLHMGDLPQYREARGVLSVCLDIHSHHLMRPHDSEGVGSTAPVLVCDTAEANEEEEEVSVEPGAVAEVGGPVGEEEANEEEEELSAEPGAVAEVGGPVDEAEEEANEEEEEVLVEPGPVAEVGGPVDEAEAEANEEAALSAVGTEAGEEEEANEEAALSAVGTEAGEEEEGLAEAEPAEEVDGPVDEAEEGANEEEEEELVGPESVAEVAGPVDEEEEEANEEPEPAGEPTVEAVGEEDDAPTGAKGVETECMRELVEEYERELKNMVGP
jgi:hypothetical protein